MDSDLDFLRVLGLTVAIQLVWIVPLVIYRWSKGRPLTAQGPPPSFRDRKTRVQFVLAIGIAGGLSIAGLVTPPVRPILPSAFLAAVAGLSLWFFVYEDRKLDDENE